MILNGYPCTATTGPRRMVFNEKKLTFFRKTEGEKKLCNMLVLLQNFLSPQFEWGTAYGGD